MCFMKLRSMARHQGLGSRKIRGLTVAIGIATVVLLVTTGLPTFFHGHRPTVVAHSWIEVAGRPVASNSTSGFVAYAPSGNTPSVVPPAIGSWPTYEYAMNRSGHTTTEATLSPQNASQLQLEWNITLPGPVYASPTVVNGTVYVGCWDGYEYAINATNGTINWKVFLGVENFSGHSYGASWLSPLGVSSSAAVYNGILYVGAFTDYVAINTTTHSIAWNTSVGQVSSGKTNLLDSGYYSWSSPTLYKGGVYVGLSSQIDNPFPAGGIWELSANTGAVVHKWWSGATNNQPVLGASVWSTPTIDASNNTLWVTTGNSASGPQNTPYAESIIALNASTLALQGAWTVSSPGNIDSDFGAGVTLFSNGSASHYVVATNKNGWAYALNGTKLYSGLAWKRDTSDDFPGQSTCTHFQAPGLSISPGSYDGRFLYLGSVFTKVNTSHVQGTVRSIDPSNGGYRWTAVTNGTVSAGLATGDGLVAAVSRWYHVIGPDSNGCYTDWGTNQSWLQVFNASNGNQLFKYYFGYPVVCAPTIADGRIFVGATINNTKYWNTEQIHLGHLYAFGLRLGAPTQVHPEVSATYGAGILAYGNATGGMPSYGSMGWVWGDGNSVGGHGGLHWFTYWPISGVFTSSFSLVDATNNQAGSVWKVYLKLVSCGPGGSSYCTVVIANQCTTFLGLCYSGPIPISWFTGLGWGFPGHITSWSWLFGDGGRSSVQSPSYQYASHGTYTVTLTMTDNENNNYVVSTQATV